MDLSVELEGSGGPWPYQTTNLEIMNVWHSDIFKHFNKYLEAIGALKLINRTVQSNHIKSYQGIKYSKKINSISCCFTKLQ